MEKLQKIQSELKAPKNQKNTFGGYNYRSCEDILEALKPLLEKFKCSLVISDDIIVHNVERDIIHVQTQVKDGIKHDFYNQSRFYVKATATLIDNEKEGSSISASALARETDVKKGMDEAQITGAASSYARKYALNGLFAIDDTKDADTMNNATEANLKPQKTIPTAIPQATKPSEAVCEKCGKKLIAAKSGNLYCPCWYGK